MPDSALQHVWLISRREYLERVRTKAFLIMTLVTPALMFAWAVVPSMMMTAKTGGTRRIVVAISNPVSGAAIRDALIRPARSAPKQNQSSARQTGQEKELVYAVEIDPNLSEDERSLLESKIDLREIDGFLWLDDKALQDHSIPYTARATSDFIEMSDLQFKVRDALLKQELRSRGLSQVELDRVLASYHLETTQWVNGRPKRSSEGFQFMTVLILGLSMYITILIFGLGVMRAILQEKQSRIMEVLMSSVTATELMAGKILGVGAVGLTQIAIWFLMGSFLAAPGAFSLASKIKEANLSAATGIYFAIFFLLGYFLYSTMCAALGAMVNSEQEAQQIQMFVLMPLILSFLGMFRAMVAPEDPIVVAASMFPFATPLMMYTRIVVLTPPLWQIVLSIVLTILTIFGMLFVCGRIYRVGILMYGKRPTLPEILKWIRYA